MGSYLWNNKLGRAHFINEDKDGRWWRYGRLFLHTPWSHLQARFEWCVRRDPHSWGIELDVGGEDNTLGYSVGIPFIGTFYGHFDFLPWSVQRKLKITEQRSTGFKVHDGSIWFELHREAHASYYSRAYWRKKTRRERWAIRLQDGMHASFHYVDFLLGSTKYTSEPLSEHEAVVHLPEGDYPVLVTLERATWTRARWRDKVVMRADVQPMVSALPTPGKGTQSYNCGEDATFGLTCPATTVEEAVEAMRDSVMRSRENYGSGEKWRPTKDWTLKEHNLPKSRLLAVSS